jgi:hypothetical protein
MYLVNGIIKDDPYLYLPPSITYTYMYATTSTTAQYAYVCYGVCYYLIRSRLLRRTRLTSSVVVLAIDPADSLPPRREGRRIRFISSTRNRLASSKGNLQVITRLPATEVNNAPTPYSSTT